MQNAVHQGWSIGTSINRCKELSNTRPNVGTPDYYAKAARDLCTHKCTHLRHCIVGGKLNAMGLNLLHSVGAGAVSPPRLIVLEYVGNPKSADSTALVGKGVTFDCGGLHVKPYGYMEQMHMDMAGAATVLGALRAMAQLNLRANATAVLALAEKRNWPRGLQNPRPLCARYPGKQSKCSTQTQRAGLSSPMRSHLRRERQK